MTNARQKSLFLVLLENAPSITFLVLLHWSGELRIAGWCGALVAAIVCTAYLTRKLQPHTILLGINVYILVITPTIETLFLLGMNAMADVLIANGQSLVLVSIAVTGGALTAFAKNGFVGKPSPHRKRVLHYSLALLAASLLSVIWTFSVDAEQFAEVGIPLLMLFGVRQFLVARLEDRGDQEAGGSIAAPIAMGTGTQQVDLGA